MCDETNRESGPPGGTGGGGETGGGWPGGAGGADSPDLAELRSRFANLADLYRTTCDALARVTAERDAARAEAETAWAAVNSMIDELADVTEGD